MPPLNPPGWTDSAAIVRVLREFDVSADHYDESDGTAFVIISGFATVAAEDARVLERVMG
jgi:hypothetical protein